MIKKSIYDHIHQQSINNTKLFALLIDPDKAVGADLKKLLDLANSVKIDLIYMGGSLLTENTLDQCISTIKEQTDIPVILFPGHPSQIHKKADAIFFLSLISGRNPELLIGQHVIAAPYLKRSGLEIMPTGYILVDSGRETTASYISNTKPIPADKADIAACTAMAGEMLGLKLIYLDGGSGAQNPVPNEMVSKIKENISLPLIVGGGIKTPEEAYNKCKAGADVVVVGNAVEADASLLFELVDAVHTS